MSRRLRVVVAAGGPLAVITLLWVVAAAIVWSRLPDPVPSTYSVAGEVVGVMGLWPWVGVTIAYLAGSTAMVTAVAGQSVNSSTKSRKMVLAGGWAAAGFLGVVSFATLVAVVDLRDAASGGISPAVLPAAMGTAILAAVVAAVMPQGVQAPAPAPDLVTPPVEFSDHEEVAWVRHVGSPWISWVGAAAVAVGVVSAAFGQWPAALSLGIGGIAASMLSSAQVIVNRKGLSVRFGLIGVPRKNIPASDVVKAVASDISPGQFGGWGYRVVPGGSGLIIRAGRGLVVTRRSGRKFTVTVDDAESAASILMELTTSNSDD